VKRWATVWTEAYRACYEGNGQGILAAPSVDGDLAHLVKSKVRTVPGDEQDGRVRAIASKPAAPLPVRVAPDPVPRLVRQAVNTGDLVEGRQLVLVEALQVLETEDIEVELVGKVPLEVPDLAAEGDGSPGARGGGHARDGDVAAHAC